MLSTIKAIIRHKLLVGLIISLLFTISSGLECFAGSDKSRTDSTKSLAKEFKQRAQRLYRSEDFFEAAKFYEKSVILNPEDAKATYRLATIYRTTRNYFKAKQYYDSVIVYDFANKYLLAYYYAGIVSRNLEEYKTAIDYFTVFRKKYRGQKDPLKLRRVAQKYIQSCEWAIEHKNEYLDISINHLNSSINKPHIEFSPFLIDENTMIFGSIRSDSASVHGGMRQLYKAEKINGTWQFADKLDRTINKRRVHTGNAVVSKDNLRMYFTRCEKNWQEKTICSIYLSNYEEEAWQKAEKLPYPVNDENYTTTQPTLGINQRTGKDILYFVSDRPGTKGGYDIWYTERIKSSNDYKEPKNLGRTINTMGNENTPYYDIESNTMHFSSTGHKGFGGYDVFSSIGSKKKWLTATSFAKPVNSSVDDYYLVMLPNQKEGFFTSNRQGSYAMDNGGCCDDIFHFKINECIKTEAFGTVINRTNYDVYDELNERYNLGLEYPEDKLPVENIPVEVYMVDSTSEQFLYYTTKTDKDGKFNLNLDVNKDYFVLVKNYGYFDKKINLSTKSIKCSDSINLGITQINALPEITVRFNVYYEHDKARLTKEASSTIDSLLPIFDLFPNAIIEIGSHTDNTGSDNYNFKLSQRRSESVINYLLKTGILKDRLVAKGYGESQPIRPNTNPDGSDNPENRQLNRRTELKIIGVINNFYIDEQ